MRNKSIFRESNAYLILRVKMQSAPSHFMILPSKLPRSSNNVDHVTKLPSSVESENRAQRQRKKTQQNTSLLFSSQHPITHNGIRVESVRSYVRHNSAWTPSITPIEELCHQREQELTRLSNSYNKYLSVAARVVRRSLKDDKRLQAERRGEMELRFAKWNVSALS